MDNEEKYKYIFKYRTLSLVCSYMGLLTIFLGVYNKYLIVIPVILYIIAFVLWSKYWKCPVCEQNFNFRHGSMDRITHCPYCGEQLRNNNYPYDYRNY